MREIPVDWGPPAAARFASHEARDRFLHSIATHEDHAWIAEAMPEDDLGAWVRWRPNEFLGLNDIAYAHGGRIAVLRGRRSRVG